jgi:hypothetical protein
LDHLSSTLRRTRVVAGVALFFVASICIIFPAPTRAVFLVDRPLDRLTTFGATPLVIAASFRTLLHELGVKSAILVIVISVCRRIACFELLH